jgi:hypothetical protein
MIVYPINRIIFQPDGTRMVPIFHHSIVHSSPLGGLRPYPPACKPYGLEAGLEANCERYELSSFLLMIDVKKRSNQTINSNDFDRTTVSQ